MLLQHSGISLEQNYHHRRRLIHLKRPLHLKLYVSHTRNLYFLTDNAEFILKEFIDVEFEGIRIIINFIYTQ